MMRKRILIADDNELVRKLLHLMLERDAGWGVVQATNGREAIAKARECKPDVVIVDFAMPDLDGLATAREIAKLSPGAAIILFTIHDSPEMAVAAKQAGVSRVLPKTAAGVPLIRAVEELLAKKPETSRQDTPEPAPGLVNEFVNDSAAVIAAPPMKANTATMQAEAGESASAISEGEPPLAGSAATASEAN